MWEAGAMSQLFISHSSQDNFAAKGLADWLSEQGFSEIFLDLDPERGIQAGERWERRLNQAALRCQAVVFLMSKNWLESRWCWKEYSLARGKNKTLFAASIDEELSLNELPPQLKGTWQVIDLAKGVQTFMVQIPGSNLEQHVNFSEVALGSLRRGLVQAGLDPKFFLGRPRTNLTAHRTPVLRRLRRVMREFSLVERLLSLKRWTSSAAKPMVRRPVCMFCWERLEQVSPPFSEPDYCRA